MNICHIFANQIHVAVDMKAVQPQLLHLYVLIVYAYDKH